MAGRPCGALPPGSSSCVLRLLGVATNLLALSFHIARFSSSKVSYIVCHDPGGRLMTSTALAGPGAVASPRDPVRMPTARFHRRARPGRGRPARTVIPGRPVAEHAVVRHTCKRSWLIRVMRLIRCTIDPRINHEARINHCYRTHELIARGDVCE